MNYEAWHLGRQLHYCIKMTIIASPRISGSSLVPSRVYLLSLGEMHYFKLRPPVGAVLDFIGQISAMKPVLKVEKGSGEYRC